MIEFYVDDIVERTDDGLIVVGKNHGDTEIKIGTKFTHVYRYEPRWSLDDYAKPAKLQYVKEGVTWVTQIEVFRKQVDTLVTLAGDVSIIRPGENLGIISESIPQEKPSPLPTDESSAP